MKKLLLLLIISCGLSCDNKKQAKEDTTSTLPNIIFIVADDLGYGDLSCYGQKKFSTPNIDQLAAKGMLFTQHYAGATVCAPSRSALMTGLHTGHTYIRGNKEVRPEGQLPLPDSIYTMAEMLRDQGYTTGAFGKWGLGPVGSTGDPINQGFDRFYGYNCQRIGHHYYPYYLYSDQDSVLLLENEGKSKNQYAPVLIHQETLSFIEANQSQPFFCYVPTIIPHAELVAPEPYMAKYRGKYLPEKKYIGYDDGPLYRQGGYESQDEPHAAFAAMISILDRQVGEIMAKVEELGIADNTLIIFTSDNGPHKEGGADPDYFDSNGPLRGYKRDLYEGGIRVPMIARWDGVISPGSKSNHISAFWDFIPTFAELAMTKYPRETDGISILPTLMGSNQTKHDYLYWEFRPMGGRKAVRMGKWKGVKYDILKNNASSELELYDLSNDIGENNNIAKQHPDIVKELLEIMEIAHQPSDEFPFPEI